MSWLLCNRNGRSFLLAGFMDGSVTVLDVSSGDELAKLKLHSKYVVRALWSPDGRHIVSSSWDGSIAISGRTTVPFLTVSN